MNLFGYIWDFIDKKREKTEDSKDIIEKSERRIFDSRNSGICIRAMAFNIPRTNYGFYGKIKREIPIIRKSNKFEGNVTIQYKDVQEELKDSTLFMLKSEGGKFFLTVIHMFVYNTENQEITELSIPENMGGLCIDSLEPKTIMVGFSTEYCKKK